MKRYKVQVFNEVVEVKGSRVSVAVSRALDSFNQLPAQPSCPFQITVTPGPAVVRVWYVVANVPEATKYAGWNRKHRVGQYKTKREAAAARKLTEQQHPDWTGLRVDWEYV